MSQFLNFCCWQQITSFFRRCYYNRIEDCSSINNVSRSVIISHTMKDLNSSMNTSADISTTWNTSSWPIITFAEHRVYAEERRLNQIYLELE